ncbi:MAG: hypothetical protein E6Q97_16020 [Desulfurellales bacterium]|nr:MAG: hypothetical protein E6Q97_16020 [Desulfurellales bacterium]
MAVNKATDGTLKAGALNVKTAITAASITQMSATFTVGAEAANAINVAVQLKDGQGVALARAAALPWYLATNATGLTPATSAPNGGTAAGTNGKIIEWTAELSGLMVFTAAGQANINITDSGTPTLYLVVVLPGGILAVSGAITFA